MITRIIKKYPKILALAIFIFPFSSVFGQDDKVDLYISPSIDGWVTRVGEEVHFEVSINGGKTNFQKGILIIQIGPEMMEPYFVDTLKEFSGTFTSDRYTMKTPGFLRCIAIWSSGKILIKKICTLGFSVDKISPTIKEPNDFDTFWNNNLKELKNYSLVSKITFLLEKSTKEVDVFHVEIGNIGFSKIFGILAMPHKKGKYPAVLQVPGAGVRPYGPDLKIASRGAIVLTIGIHGVPVNLDSLIYLNLAKGALKQYFNYGINNKESNYYRRVILGCLRVNDYICTLNSWDRKNLVVMGGSQGGALSMITAALDSRVTLLCVLYPAMCDLTGYLYGRAGGWPHYFATGNKETIGIKNLENSISYYDVVNFAKRIKIPGIYSWGFNDIVCPPTSMYAAFNVINAPKQLEIYRETGHWAYPEQKRLMEEWLFNNFKN